MLFNTKLGDLYIIKKFRTMYSNTSNYINTNDMVSNFVFLLIILVLTIILYQVIAANILQMLSPSNNPHLIDGMIDTKSSQFKIYQDPKKNYSKTILISDNKDKGLEFTWSFWIYIDNLDYRRGELKNVWIKGDNNFEDNTDISKYEESDITFEELNNSINSPGVYLTPHSNKLLFVFNTFNKVVEKFDIDNIPMNKWVNVIIRCENKTIDIFLNSSFTKRFILTSLPKQNYNNVYIGKNGGFAGFVSNLWYFNSAIGAKKINDIYRQGPNTKLLNSTVDDAVSTVTNNNNGLFSSTINWISFRWFSQ